MKRAGAFAALFLVVILAACGRSAEEVALVSESVLTSSAATRAAMPTATPPPTPEAAAATQAAGDTAGSTTEVVGDAASGETLFNTAFQTASGQWMCANCHSTAENRLIGPGLGGIAQWGGTMVEGEDAYQYIVHSITRPNDFIAPADAAGAYPADLMPQNYAEVFSEQQINDLAAYLLTLQ